MKHIYKECQGTERIAFNSILIAVLLTVFYQTFHTYYPSVIDIVLSLIIIFFVGRGWLLYYRRNSQNKWGRLYVALIVYFLIVGTLHGAWFNHAVIGGMLSQDIRYVLFFLIGGVFAFDDKMKYFHQIMRILGVISIVFGVLALVFYTPNIQTLEMREGTWSLSYYFWWCSSACFYYWGYYALFVKKELTIGYGVIIAYVFLGLLFLKRSVVVDFAVMIIFYALFAPKKTGYIKPLVFITFVFIFVALFRGGLLNTLFNLLMGRFDLSIEEFDRQLEADAYFSIANRWDLIFGNGIGHYYDSLYIRDEAGILNALHLGWANIIYKGGVVYVLYSLAMYFAVVKKIFQLPKDSYGKVCLGVAISSLVSMLYAGGWTYTIAPFCISAPIFYIITHGTNTRYLTNS